MWRRWDTPQNLFLAFIDELEKQIIIKKAVEVDQQKENNFNIYHVTFLKKYKEKHLWISLSKCWWYDLQLLKYRQEDNEIGNFRSVFALLLPKNLKSQDFEKWRNLLEIFYTCVSNTRIIWCMVPEMWSETDKKFLSLCIVFCLFTPLWT